MVEESDFRSLKDEFEGNGVLSRGTMLAGALSAVIQLIINRDMILVPDEKQEMSHFSRFNEDRDEGS